MARVNIGLGEVNNVLGGIGLELLPATFVKPPNFGIVIGLEVVVERSPLFIAQMRLGNGELGVTFIKAAEQIADMSILSDTCLGHYASQEGYGVAAWGFHDHNLLVAQRILDRVFTGADPAPSEDFSY